MLEIIAYAVTGGLVLVGSLALWALVRQAE